MTGIVRPARGGQSTGSGAGTAAQNKVTKPSSPNAARRHQQHHHHHHQHQLQHNRQLLAAALVEQQRLSVHHSADAIHPDLRAAEDAALRMHDDPLAGTVLDDQSHHHSGHHHHLVDLHALPDPDDDHKQPDDPDTHLDHSHSHNHAHTHTHPHSHSLHPHDDHSAAAKAVAMATSVTQNMDLGPDGSLLDPSPGLLDATAMSSNYDSPPQPSHDPNASVPNPQHHHLDFGAPMRLTEDLAGVSGYSGFVIESALAKRLSREPGLRTAQQRRPEQTLNLGRRSNVEALFAHIAGEEVVSACKNCRKGHGPWTTCVIVDGQMCGSCANCWFNASGARCSFHETRNNHVHMLPQQQQHHAHTLQTPAPQQPSAQDPYGVGSPLSLTQTQQPGMPGTTISFSPVMGGASTNGITAADPTMRLAVERAMADVRRVAGDRKARQLMKIDLTARKLALQILEYEDMLAQDSEPHSQHAAGDVNNSAGTSGQGVVDAPSDDVT